MGAYDERGGKALSSFLPSDWIDFQAPGAQAKILRSHEPSFRFTTVSAQFTTRLLDVGLALKSKEKQQLVYAAAWTDVLGAVSPGTGTIYQ